MILDANNIVIIYESIRLNKIIILIACLLLIFIISFAFKETQRRQSYVVKMLFVLFDNRTHYTS